MIPSLSPELFVLNVGTPNLVPIGRGCVRRVYAFGSHHVLKIEIDPGSADCFGGIDSEVEVYNTYGDTHEELCPIIASGETKGKKWLIMEKVDAIGCCEPDNSLCISDVHSENYGCFIHGDEHFPVIIDYAGGVNLSMSTSDSIYF